MKSIQTFTALAVWILLYTVQQSKTSTYGKVSFTLVLNKHHYPITISLVLSIPLQKQFSRRRYDSVDCSSFCNETALPCLLAREIFLTPTETLTFLWTQSLRQLRHTLHGLFGMRTAALQCFLQCAQANIYELFRTVKLFSRCNFDFEMYCSTRRMNILQKLPLMGLRDQLLFLQTLMSNRTIRMKCATFCPDTLYWTFNLWEMSQHITLFKLDFNDVFNNILDTVSYLFYMEDIIVVLQIVVVVIVVSLLLTKVIIILQMVRHKNFRSGLKY